MPQKGGGGGGGEKVEKEKKKLLPSTMGKPSRKYFTTHFPKVGIFEGVFFFFFLNHLAQ